MQNSEFYSHSVPNLVNKETITKYMNKYSTKNKPIESNFFYDYIYPYLFFIIVIILIIVALIIRYYYLKNQKQKKKTHV